LKITAAYAALCEGVSENRRLPGQGSPLGGYFMA
jgi:hypothetical protein